MNLQKIRWKSFGVQAFIAVHALALVGVVWAFLFAPTPFSTGLIISIFLGYYVRMWFVTCFTHRYFAHKSFSWRSQWLERIAEPVMAFLFTTCLQKGAVWWASHHRVHHQHSDTPLDPHTCQTGMWHCHAGWVIEDDCDGTVTDKVRDWLRKPSVMWFERNHLIGGLFLGIAYFCFGGMTHVAGYGSFLADGAHAVVCGMFVSTVLLWHGTFCINSLAHRIGRRRFDTNDSSKNSLLLALLTLGEGWHNNHHRHQSRAWQAWTWWEKVFDPTGITIWLASLVGLVRIKKP